MLKMMMIKLYSEYFNSGTDTVGHKIGGREKKNRNLGNRMK